MKLIVGLGNPEAKYNHTRHNLGFYVLDDFAKKHQLTFAPSAKFKAQIAKQADYTLVKPATYYNLIGESVQKIASYFQVGADDILLIYDDLALPLGAVRTRLGGGDAGNNGIKSITQMVGANTARIRIGTYTERRDQMDDATYVLAKLPADELELVRQQLPQIEDHIANFLNGAFTATTHQVAE